MKHLGVLQVSTAWIKFLWIRDLPYLKVNCFEIQD